jgi:hypothetical protein
VDTLKGHFLFLRLPREAHCFHFAVERIQTLFFSAAIHSRKKKRTITLLTFSFLPAGVKATRCCRIRRCVLGERSGDLFFFFRECLPLVLFFFFFWLVLCATSAKLSFNVKYRKQRFSLYLPRNKKPTLFSR